MPKPGIVADRVRTPRLDTHLLRTERQDGEPVLFVHGNLSSSVFWQDAMLALAPGYRGIAVDLRAFGDSEAKPIDATRGCADFSDDIVSLIETLDLGPVHLVGWSLGGGVVLTILRDTPELVRTVTLVNPVSPYGFGGTIDDAGSRAYADGAGGGGGVVNPEFVQRLKDRDRSADSPLSPRNVMNSTYFRPPFRAADEELFLESMLQEAIGADFYPGDLAPSPNWPGVAPGGRGVLNTITANHLDLEPVLEIEPKPPVLWIRGEHDVIVSDESALDMANLGRLGVVPGWPGGGVCPPQPMVGQTRTFLQRYADAGGSFREVVLDAAHSPHIERPAEFGAALHGFLSEVDRS